MKSCCLAVLGLCLAGFSIQASTNSSVARVWDEQILSAIRIDLPNPPVHARNLFHLSVAMYDSWAAYDSVAVGYLYHKKCTATDVAAARNQAISYAAYRILKERYALSKNSTNTLAALDVQMTTLGYDTNNVSTDTSIPAGVGNSVAAAVSGYFLNDGSLQTNRYSYATDDPDAYVPSNSPLDVGASGTTAVNPNRWQPLSITNGATQNGIPVPTVQTFVGSMWKNVRPFALTRNDPAKPWIDPGPPPQLGGVGDAQYRNAVVEMITRSSQLTPDDLIQTNISPGAIGNNTVGANDGAGHPVNPVTGVPYVSNVVKRGDFTRVLAEFWADGPNSETPPGHWNVIANNVGDTVGFQKKLGGTGPVLDDLQWDVKLYFALNAAVHDAACAAWTLKRYYDGWRPIEAIRYMGQLGQSSDQNAAKYDPNGLPLVTNLIELVTAASAQPGGRHAGLTAGTVAVYTWPGQPADPINTYSGVHWIEAVNWVPYQKSTFVTPAFPGFISGHSTFSRSAAEILTAVTGSPFFPGGLGTYTVSSLNFEKGPTQPVTLQWGTYYDASDQAGLSRIWGGIHPSVDDLTGRRTGSQCGQAVWALARQYFDGSIMQVPVTLTIQPGNSSGCQVRYNTLRGFYYLLQSTTDLSLPFSDDPAGLLQATDVSQIHFDAGGIPCRFFRVLRSTSQ